MNAKRAEAFRLDVSLEGIKYKSGLMFQMYNTAYQMNDCEINSRTVK